LLARASLSKESSANVKTALASKAAVQPESREQEQSLEQFTPPKFPWHIGNIAMSALGDDGRPNQGDNGAPGGPARHLTRHLPWPIQAKLEVGAVDDLLEREADRVADQAMGMPDPRASTNFTALGSSSALQRGSPKVSDVTVQRDPAAPHISQATSSPVGSEMTAPAIVHEVLRSPGQPLDPQTRAFFEPRLGYDFGAIRVHTSDAAAESARLVDAKAYTTGTHLAFAGGKYAPESQAGRHLLAHELVHVVQQNRIGAAVQRSPDPWPDVKWKRDEKAARYRGKLVADRILHHGKVSEDARTRIKSELAYFEGAAKDAYIAQIRPALQEVGKTEVIESETKATAPSRSTVAPAPSDFVRRMTSDPKYIDNDISKVSFYSAELAILYYRDGSSLELGLSPKLMKPPFVEVDYHTAREDLVWYVARDRTNIVRLKEIPPGVSFGEMQKHAYPVDFAALTVKRGAHIVPTRVNMAHGAGALQRASQFRG
jgi:hypothetical protein